MRVFGWISVACAAVLAASVAHAGGAPTPSCIVGVYTTSDVFFLDANGNGTFDGSATDAAFRIAPGLGAGSLVLGDFAAGGGDGVGKYIAASAAVRGFPERWGRFHRRLVGTDPGFGRSLPAR